MKRLVMIFAAVLFVTGLASAQTIKVSLADNIPPDVVDSKNGLLVDLIQAMNKIPNGKQFKIIGAFPFPRSIMNVTTGEADLHLPLLKDPNVPEDSLGYAYSTGTFTVVPFVLYTNASNTKINKSNIRDFKVYIQPAHKGFFKDGKGEMPIEGALQRLNSGDIDGYICAMITGDSMIKSKHLSNIKRQLFASFESKAIIPKGEKGVAIDKAFTEALMILKENGTLYKVYPGVKFVVWD